MKINVPVNRRFAVLAASVIFTGLSIYSAATTSDIARRSSEETLKSTAYFIGITLDQAINRMGIDEGLIAEIMKKQRHETIAYIALYDGNGKIALHSNPRLIGQTDPQRTGVASDGAPRSSYVTLKTGELVYVMNIPVHIHGSAAPMALSIALHTYPALEAVRNARLHQFILLIINTAMWALAVAFIYYLKKTDRLQEMARQKERFTALGEMAAVLAHEIRSPLSAIKGFAQYIREKFKDNAKAAEGLDVIVNESRRLESLTNDLLVYARPPELNIQAVALDELITEAIGVVNVGGGVAIERNISVTNGTIQADREKLKQILINCISNASDSIEESGKIYITAEEDKQMVTLTIKDTGRGMDEATLKEARRPFFTTKARGTGLGLPIVDNLAHAMAATLSIESQAGCGTSVSITMKRIL